MDSHTHSAFGRLEIVETGRRRRWSEDEKVRIVLSRWRRVIVDAEVDPAALSRILDVLERR